MSSSRPPERRHFSSSEKQHSPSTIRIWLRRHEAFLAAIGLLTVIATFVTKEVFRDNLKELADSVDRAQITYSLRVNIDSLRTEIRYLDSRISSLKLSSSNAPPTDTTQMLEFADSFDNCRRTVMENLISYEVWVDEARQLVEKLPYDKAAEEQLRPLQQGSAAFEAQAKSLLQAIDKAISDQTLAVGAGLAPNPLPCDTLPFALRVQAHLPEASAFSSRQLERAEEVKRNAERRYRLFSIVSYVLFGIGILLALIGRVYRIRGLGAEG
jgi:hypothetical protein